MHNEQEEFKIKSKNRKDLDVEKALQDLFFMSAVFFSVG